MRIIDRVTERAWTGATTWLGRAAHRLAGERGEGVISAAIAILVIAFLGVAMWFAFDMLMGEATDTISDQVRDIGS